MLCESFVLSCLVVQHIRTRHCHCMENEVQKEPTTNERNLWLIQYTIISIGSFVYTVSRCLFADRHASMGVSSWSSRSKRKKEMVNKKQTKKNPILNTFKILQTACLWTYGNETKQKNTNSKRRHRLNGAKISQQHVDIVCWTMQRLYVRWRSRNEETLSIRSNVV